MRITVAGVGYVGLSLAVLLSQRHQVTAITTTEAKAEKLNQFISPIQDDEIERFFEEAREGSRKLNLHTTTDKEAAYCSTELVIIATPTNYDDVHHFFDTSAVEDAIEWTLKVNPNVLMVIKSMLILPDFYTKRCPSLKPGRQTSRNTSSSDSVFPLFLYASIICLAS